MKRVKTCLGLFTENQQMCWKQPWFCYIPASILKQGPDTKNYKNWWEGLHASGGWTIIAVVQLLSHVWFFPTRWTAACRASLSSLFPRVCSNSCPLSWWCYLTFVFSAALFSFCLQSFPASGSFPVGQLFASGSQSIGAPHEAKSVTVDCR